MVKLSKGYEVSRKAAKVCERAKWVSLKKFGAIKHTATGKVALIKH